ncbi:hypothetical protein GCM10010909_34480 [Acidocella aquatica]|uniref:Uncharacterized protein n=1 Tax=Acidocella aquatica TaxID=1922313 RepID=A0ABQ6A988_9PROT|nr:hypothetical protein [Acidocella aquatica]GLR68766.1 hypothetical protein GCM10010909_34480 [Acidocella aquatica]
MLLQEGDAAPKGELLANLDEGRFADALAAQAYNDTKLYAPAMASSRSASRNQAT